MGISENIRHKLIESLLKEMPAEKPTKDAEVIYRTNNMIVVVPHTKAASCRYGSGTKWCLSDASYDPTRWGSYEKKEGQGILFFVIIYEDDPKTGEKKEKYKFYIFKTVNSGAEEWNDIREKRIYNKEMMQKLIIPTEAYQKIIDYWKTNRINFKPKFKVGDYVIPNEQFRTGWSGTFKSLDGSIKVYISWRDGKYIVVAVKPSKIIIQLIGSSKRLRDSARENKWDKERLDKINNALDNDVPLYNTGNIYNFVKVG